MMTSYHFLFLSLVQHFYKWPTRMVFETELYDILGVSTNSNHKQIKQAYIAKMREANSNKIENNSDQIQKLNKAYEILKDPKKRRNYDKYGMRGTLRNTTRGKDIFDIFDVFHNFQFDSFDDFNYLYGSQKKLKADDIIYNLNMTLEDLFVGKEIKLKINRTRICNECKGTGLKNGFQRIRCKNCQGKGNIVKVHRNGPMITQQITTCGACNGTGFLVDEKDSCKKCGGDKVIKETKQIVVNIKPGTENNQKIVFKGESDEFPDAEAGDFIVCIKEQKHNVFTRKYANLLVDKDISLASVLTFEAFTITHLDGRILVVKPNKQNNILENSIMCIKSEGMPYYDNILKKGDLFIRFHIIFPIYQDLTPELKEELNNIHKQYKTDEQDLTQVDDVFTLKDASESEFDDTTSESDQDSYAFYYW